MIVCSCNYISEKDIVGVIVEMLDADAWQLIVPGKVYRMLEKRGKCCGCFPNVVEIIVRSTKAYHDGLKTRPEATDKLIARIRGVGEAYRNSATRRAS